MRMPGRTATLAEIEAALAEERAYQDREWPSAGPLTVGEELLLLNVYLGRAMYAWQGNQGDEKALAEVRKMAAMLQRCMEHHGVVARSEEPAAAEEGAA